MESTEKLIKELSYVNILNHTKEILQKIVDALKKSEEENIRLNKEIENLKNNT